MDKRVDSPPAGVPVMDVDFYGAEIVADPWPILKKIREAGPVVWNKAGHWMTAQDKVCRQIFNRPGPLGQEGTVSSLFGAEAFISIDDKPRHNALRNVWVPAFRRDSLEALAPVIRKFAMQMLDAAEPDLRAGKHVDMMATYCRPLPACVMASMMGIPDEMLSSVITWSDDMGNATSGGFPIDYDNDPHWLAGEKAKKDLADYILGQIAFRRKSPGDDLISQMVHSDVAKTLSDQAMMVNIRQLLFAGNETTAKWLGQILVILARNADVRREIIAKPELLPQALDETMRWEPVVHTLPRGITTDDVVVADVPLKRGEEMILLLGGANRDPARYPDPDRFDIHRERKANLGFGYGLHSCLGVTLAQVEAQEVTKAFLARFPNYTVREPVQYTGFIMRGPGPVDIALS